ncbi:quercetin dioxygenase-like cupin family protein [Saccharomonospora amisosensis]|uniref:Quercetin dioxygenase-like cupin family protein n=1 Tax=Saccharomonospora amisosensis TaxID=1128677 RepID=A0A7X5UUB6_9PSEU|nr:cupin domain-containing protein [Saccharomonospora amisosensis]NIJ13844.1 quercetin dioxygenase-like cupin family protein [Saccharomonospora amisosensis]
MTLATLMDAPTFDIGGFQARSLAVPSRGSTELAVWSLEAAPGAATEWHTVDREEVFVLQEGKVLVEVGEQVHELTAGDAAIATPGVPFRLRNPAAVAARLTVCTSKGMRGTVNGRTIDPPWAQ